MERMFVQGFHGTGVQEITDAAGVPKGSFYNYFESKEAFTAEVIQMYAARLHAFVEKTLSEDISPRERVMKLYDGLVHYYENDEKHIHEGCFAGNIGQEMTADPIGQAVLDFFRGFRKPIAICLAEAMEKGEIKQSDPQFLADFITDSYQGALMRMKLENSALPLRRFREVLEGILI